ncbi:hypothetical protein QJQ45_003679 [Haematococcus lacustris]|nr:hypothetical protein QJQ45_003679 [Haematococcus lacustris]
MLGGEEEEAEQEEQEEGREEEELLGTGLLGVDALAAVAGRHLMQQLLGLGPVPDPSWSPPPSIHPPPQPASQPAQPPEARALAPAVALPGVSAGVSAGAQGSAASATSSGAGGGGRSPQPTVARGLGIRLPERPARPRSAALPVQRSPGENSVAAAQPAWQPPSPQAIAPTAKAAARAPARASARAQAPLPAVQTHPQHAQPPLQQRTPQPSDRTLTEWLKQATSLLPLQLCVRQYKARLGSAQVSALLLKACALASLPPELWGVADLHCDPPPAPAPAPTPDALLGPEPSTTRPSGTPLTLPPASEQPPRPPSPGLVTQPGAPPGLTHPRPLAGLGQGPEGGEGLTQIQGLLPGPGPGPGRQQGQELVPPPAMLPGGGLWREPQTLPLLGGGVLAGAGQQGGLTLPLAPPLPPPSPSQQPLLAAPMPGSWAQMVSSRAATNTMTLGSGLGPGLGSGLGPGPGSGPGPGLGLGSSPPPAWLPPPPASATWDSGAAWQPDWGMADDLDGIAWAEAGRQVRQGLASPSPGRASPSPPPAALPSARCGAGALAQPPAAVTVSAATPRPGGHGHGQQQQQPQHQRSAQRASAQRGLGSGPPSSPVPPFFPAMQAAAAAAAAAAPDQALQQLAAVVVQAARITARLAAAHKLSPATLSTSLSSFAKLGISQPAVVQPLLAAAAQALPSMSCKALVNTLWATAMLQQQPGPAWLTAAEAGVLRHMQRLGGHQLSTVVFALGCLGHSPSPGFLQALCTRVALQLGSCTPAEVANLAAGLAGLGQKPEPSWVAEVLIDGTQDRLHSFSLMQLVRLASAVAQLGAQPKEAWLEGFYSRCQQLLAGGEGGEFDMEAAVARRPGLGARLGKGRGTEPRSTQSPSQQASLNQGLGTRRPSGPSSGSSGSKARAGGGSQGGSQAAGGLRGGPGSPWDAPLRPAPLRMPQLQSLCSALAQLEARPRQEWLTELLAHGQRGLQGATAQELVELLAALAVLRFRPGGAWRHEFLAAAFAHLPSYSIPQVVQLLQSLARLGIRPPGAWLPELALHLHPRLPHLSPEQLGQLLLGLARLRFRPDPSWLAAWERAGQAQLAEAEPAALADLVCAMAAVGQQPGPSWLYAFMLAVYKQLDAFDGAQLGRMFQALPLLVSQPLWLDELVQICASQASSVRLGPAPSSPQDPHTPGPPVSPGPSAPLPTLPAANGHPLPPVNATYTAANGLPDAGAGQGGRGPGGEDRQQGTRGAPVVVSEEGRNGGSSATSSNGSSSSSSSSRSSSGLWSWPVNGAVNSRDRVGKLGVGLGAIRIYGLSEFGEAAAGRESGPDGPAASASASSPPKPGTGSSGNPGSSGGSRAGQQQDDSPIASIRLPGSGVSSSSSRLVVVQALGSQGPGGAPRGPGRQAGKAQLQDMGISAHRSSSGTGEAAAGQCPSPCSQCMVLGDPAVAAGLTRKLQHGQMPARSKATGCRPGPRPTELCYWTNRPARPKPGQPGQDWVD